MFKAVIFDIGGVVVRSPLLAIAQYEREKALPPNYINCSITQRGKNGAWQRLERGEMPLFTFYEHFGRELSDTENGNVWYTEYCKKRNIECPSLPSSINVDGRELFGRMMRESRVHNHDIVTAIQRIRDDGRWLLIALTNNYSNSMESMTHDGAIEPQRYEEELAFLGWTEGPAPPQLRSLFDDFIDSSTIGLRKPDPQIYRLACNRNNLEPKDCVFLDDLGMNLKVAQQLGMETIHVPIGGTTSAIQQLEKKLGIRLTLPIASSKL